MHRDYHRWYSHQLGRDMELLTFGHAGLPTLVFPTSMGSFHEYEDQGMVAALAGNRGQVNYAAAKGALNSATKALSLELASRGVTVNAIAPTVFRSPLTAWMFEDNEKANAVRAGFLARVPLGRLGEPGEIADVIVFLASERASFVTGTLLPVDGGVVRSPT